MWSGGPTRDRERIGPAIEVHGLVKRYGRRITAVDGLDLIVERGEVYGLLGPNGAGKSTTLRILSGLVRPSEGRVRLFGWPPGSPEALTRMGAMGENAFHPFLSGRDNLRALARRCRLPDSRVDELLGLVALTGRGRDPFSGYSLGMRQRLGVAAALLKEPQLLILDEPSNGLDPAGRRDMRSLIRDLSAADHTILLSSHDLDDVELLCGRAGIIAGGRLLVEDAPSALRGDRSLEQVFLELTADRIAGPDSVR